MKEKQNKKLVFILLALVAFFIASPLLVAYDSIIYLLTRPTCLNCGDLVGFLRSGSLTASLFATTLGYQLKQRN